MKKVLFLLGCLVIHWQTYAEIGCMDASKHAYLCYYKGEDCSTPDYKRLRYVTCSCPCWRYRQTSICAKCRHIRQPSELPIIFK